MLLIIMMIIYILSEYYINYGDKILFFEKKSLNKRYRYNDLIIKYNLLIVMYLSILVISKNYFKIILGLIIIIFINIIVDIINNKFKENFSKIIFVVKELINIMSIVLVNRFLLSKNLDYEKIIYIKSLTEINLNLIIKYLLVFILILKPANIIFKELLIEFKPTEKDEKEAEEKGFQIFSSNENAGAVIGVFERSLIMISIITNQITIIGVILAAKSIVRFKSSEVTKYGEYYIIGTMYSLLYTILVYLIVLS